MHRCNFVLALVLAGCDGSSSEESDAGLDGQAASPISVALTFDDGPVDAHVARADAPTVDSDELLRPLEDILAVLRAREARALFYLEGPGSEAAATALEATHRAGVQRMLDEGHRVGFHAFDHSPALWLTDGTPADIESDLSRLEAFLGALGLLDRATPIFRPPFGGLGPPGAAGFDAASSRGWTMHGFDVDTVDWTLNATADANLVAQLPVGCAAARLDYSLARIRAGVDRVAERETVDVLFHVNAFAAQHLDTMLSELVQAFEDRGRQPIFEIADRYLDESDRDADATFLEDLGKTASCE